MATRPTGTLLADDRLLELRETEETTASALALEFTPVADDMDAASGDHIDWDVDAYEDQPMLVCSGIPDDQTTDAPYPRQLREEGGDVVAPVPDPLVRAAPPEGIGLDIETYDADRLLLFDAVTLGETIGFVPVRFDDGEVYRSEPLPEVADDSDPVAEETIDRETGGDHTPRPETMSAPIDAVVLDDVMADAETDIPVSDVVGILERIERSNLVGQTDHVSGTSPLSVDDRVVYLLEDGAWTERLGPELEAEGVDVDTGALRAAREVHDRQATHLVQAADADENEFEDAADESDYEAVVTNARDTAEWDVSEPGTADRDGT